jgi:ribosomal-protein-alanine N-acetyltransferase
MRGRAATIGKGLMPPSAYLLRACELGDLAQVGRIEKASFPERPYSRLDFVAYLLTARDGFIVASKDGSVVGYVIAVSQGREGSIQSIAVSPDSRGKGVGEMLMRSAIDRLAGKCGRMHLLVDANNEAAIRLYRKLSFEETGRVVKKYYPNGGDAVEMARDLRTDGNRPTPG